MSAPEAEGGQDRDDILGFPGDRYQDPQDGDPLETMDEDLDSGAAGMTEESAPSGPSSAKKRGLYDLPPPPPPRTGEHNALNEDQALKMTAGNVCFIEFF